MSAATTCTECPRPARGDVPTEGTTPAHYCRQCGEHCALAAYVRRTVDAWPPLTPEQRDRLAVLLRPSTDPSGGDASPST